MKRSLLALAGIACVLATHACGPEGDEDFLTCPGAPPVTSPIETPVDAKHRPTQNTDSGVAPRPCPDTSPRVKTTPTDDE